MTEEELRIGRIHCEGDCHLRAISSVELVEACVKAVAGVTWVLQTRLRHCVIESVKAKED